MENITVLIPVAPGLQDTGKIRDKYYNYAMQKLEKICGQELRSHVILKRSYAQRDFISDYNAFQGNAYGLANTLNQTAMLKTKNKKQKNRQSFLCRTINSTRTGRNTGSDLISGNVVAYEIPF